MYVVWVSGGQGGGEGVSGKGFFDKESFFLGGQGGGGFFYKLTRNPNLTKNLFFSCGDGVGGGGNGRGVRVCA